MRGTRTLGALLLLCCAWLAGSAARAQTHFPEPPGIEDAVAFWSRVYLEASTDGGLLHDHTYLNVIYQTIRFEGAQGRERERITEQHRTRWQETLRQLARGTGPRSEDEARVLREFATALGREPTGPDLREAAERMRFQLGQSDKFRDGLVRSGAYEAAMRTIFRQAGHPEDLAFLPHVESSFNVRAYSKYGAAGAWQFMRSTGRSYMRIGYEIDERLDPMIATHAAARLLGENYRALQSWPLALTAYNHGRAGMLRAKSRHGPNIVEIIRNYRSPSFGFASRNFYAQFLAARRIARSYESYFGSLKRDPPHRAEEIELPFYLEVADLTALGVSEDVIREYNPALRNPIFQAGKRIPKGYRLRLPAGTTSNQGATWLAAVPRQNRFAEQQRPRYYEVRRGDTLSSIARRNGVSVASLQAVNGLRSRNRIFPGAVLQLPDSGGRRAQPEPEQDFELVASSSAATASTAAAVPTPAPRALPEPPRPKAARRVPEMVPAESPQRAVMTAAGPLRDATEVLPAQGGAEPEPTLAAAATAARPAASASAQRPEPAAQPARAPEPPLVAASSPRAAAASPAAAPVASLSEDSPWRRIRGDTIVVDADETLGHYAEWLEVSTSRLRRLNRLRAGSSLRMGQRIKLDFSRVAADSFLQRRIEYHKGISEDFFGSYEVVNVKDHQVRPGDSIWELSTRTYGVPAWLIHRYNPEADLTRLAPGSKLVIPVVQELQS